MSESPVPAVLELPPTLADERDRHFRTEHLQADLKSRSIRGAKATLAAQTLKFAVQAGGLVALARMLLPEDFGLVAMVTAITGFAFLFQGLGLSLPTIQRASIGHREVSSLFWLNAGFGVLLGLALCAAAPLVAWFYHRSEVLPLMLASAIMFPLGGLGIQHNAILLRQMRQGTVALIEIASLALGTAAGCVLALLGRGPWALIAMQVVTGVAGLALLWSIVRWRPSRPRRGTGLRGHLATGGRLVTHNALYYLTRNVDNVLVGRFWGPQALGLYSRGYQLLMLPMSQVIMPLFNTVVPALSRLQDDERGYREFGLQALNGLLWITLPPLALLVGTAPEAFSLALGARWRPAAVIFQYLAANAVIQPVFQLYVWTFMSRNDTAALLRYSARVAAVLVAGIAIAVPFGVRPVAIVYAAASVAIVLPITIRGLARAFRSGAAAILLRFRGPAVVSAAILAGGVAARLAFAGAGDLVRLAAEAAGSAACGALAVLAVPYARVELGALLRMVRRRGEAAAS